MTCLLRCINSYLSINAVHSIIRGDAGELNEDNRPLSSQEHFVTHSLAHSLNCSLLPLLFTYSPTHPSTHFFTYFSRSITRSVVQLVIPSRVIHPSIHSYTIPRLIRLIVYSTTHSLTRSHDHSPKATARAPHSPLQIHRINNRSRYQFPPHCGRTYWSMFRF